MEHRSLKKPANRSSSINRCGWMEIGASFLFLASPDLARAQESPRRLIADPDPDSRPNDRRPPHPDDPAAGTLPDIVVTAMRRDERLQSTPMSISVVSGGEIAANGIRTTESLTAAVPGLQFSRQIANGGAPFLRGVGTPQAAQGFASPVAFYVDDAYVGSPGAILMALAGIDRVEVLKGPQGTLFGRNATGGVINVHTRQPSGVARIDASVGVSSFDRYEADLYVTGPLSKTLAMNLTVTGQAQGQGYGQDIATGRDVYFDRHFGVRSTLRWQPGTTTLFSISGDYSSHRGDGGLNATVLPRAVASGGATFPGRYHTTNVPRDGSSGSQAGITGRLQQALGNYRLMLLGAYRKNAINYHLDNDSSAAVLLSARARARNTAFSQEIQIQSPPDAKVHWLAGGYFYRERAAFSPLEFRGAFQSALGGLQQIYSRQDSRSLAAFAEGTAALGPTWRITVGGRYTSDLLRESAVVKDAHGVAIAPGFISQRERFSKATWRLIVDHDFSDHALGYLSYNRGYKSGGFNLTSPIITVNGLAIASPAVRPEVLDAYEIGLKQDLFSRKVRLNLAAFHYDYRGLQVTVIGNGTSTSLNAASARIQGIDMDLEWAASSRLRASASVNFLHARFNSFPNGPRTLPNPATCATTDVSTIVPTGGNRTCSADLAGNATPRSPDFSANIAVSYTVPTSIGAIALTGFAYRTSGFSWEADNRLRQPGYTLLNAALDWTSNNGRYSAKLWGHNLADAYYYTYVSASALRDSGTPAEPRSAGVQFGVHF